MRGLAPRRWMRAAAALALVAAGLLSGCARTVAPMGGEVPEEPLRVVSTTPAPFSFVDPFDGPVVFTFPRTLSERLTRGSLEDAIEVSPQDGEVSVRRRGSRVEIRMEGGFRRDIVYRVTLLPRLQDRFRNVQQDQVDLYFSTGPEFEPTVLAGVVVDRLSGADVRDARVQATLGTFPEDRDVRFPGPDAPPIHSTVADSAGVFLFQFLPAGAYELRVFDDVNRNRRPDMSERQGLARAVLGEADTVLVADLAILQPDTTAARLMEVTVLDSLHLGLRFDDPLDPQVSLEGVRVILTADGPEGAVVSPTVVRVIHAYVREAEVALARWETSRDAALAADEVWDEAPPEIPDPATLRPERNLVVVLGSALPPEMSYTVQVTGVLNLSGVEDGGGEGEFTTPAAAPAIPEADPSPPDDDEDPAGSGSQDVRNGRRVVLTPGRLSE